MNKSLKNTNDFDIIHWILIQSMINGSRKIKLKRSFAYLDKDLRMIKAELFNPKE